MTSFIRQYQNVHLVNFYPSEKVSFSLCPFQLIKLFFIVFYSYNDCANAPSNDFLKSIKFNKRCTQLFSAPHKAVRMFQSAETVGMVEDVSVL